MTRYLCSELVVLKRGETDTIVNLEEIWSDGAAIEMDDGVEIGKQVELVCQENRLAGKIAGAEKHEFGWRIELKFLPATRWSPEVFRPQHMIDPDDLPGKKSPA